MSALCAQSTRRHRRSAARVLVVLLAVSIWCPAFTGQPLFLSGSAAAAAELAPGVSAPAFSLSGLIAKRTINSAEIFAARPFTLLAFWNSDCADCLYALEKCQEFVLDAEAAGIGFVGINHDVENLASTRSFLRSRNIAFLQLWDIDRLVASSYGTDSYSLSLFLIDSLGVIREAVYDRPADTEDVLSDFIREYGSAASRPTPAEKPGIVPVRAPDSLAIHFERSSVDTGPVALPPPSLMTTKRFPVELTSRISITGEVRVRFMDIQLEHDPLIPSPPTGPYGEAVERGTSMSHRALFELGARPTNSLTAGVLVRLSNEDEDVLRLGPEYFSRSEGSAYVHYREGDFSLRLGYFDAYFTPLSLMRWDAEDNARTGGTASGCACAGATGAILFESLEELGPTLTFEGLSVSQALGDILDVRAFYARPGVANEISQGEFLANPERLLEFAYRRDLYAFRASFNVNPPSFSEPALVSLHYVRTRDDEESATFVGSAYDPQGFAADNRVYGALLSVPLLKRLSLDVEIDRTETDDNVLDPIGTSDWGTGYLASLKGEILKDVSASLSYLSLSREFHSSFAALSYQPNRKGLRASLSVRRGGFDSDIFVKYLEPHGPVDEVSPSPFLPSTRSKSRDQITVGLWASIDLLQVFEVGGGWLLERETDNVYRVGMFPGPLGVHERRKNTLSLQLVRALSKRNSAELLYQYIDYADEIESMNDYSIHRTSLQFSVRF